MDGTRNRNEQVLVLDTTDILVVTIPESCTAGRAYILFWKQYTVKDQCDVLPTREQKLRQQN